MSGNITLIAEVFVNNIEILAVRTALKSVAGIA